MKPPKRARASGASSRKSRVLRGAVEGREDDLIGLGLIAAGLLLALGTYLGVAGPIGTALTWLTGGLFGVARFILPIALVVVGWSFVKDARSAHRVRLALGYGVAALAFLALLQVLIGSDSATYDDVSDAGGAIGLVVGEPLRSLLSSIGAVVVFLALIVGGVVVGTHTSLGTLVARVRTGARTAGRAMATGLRPAVGAARRKAGQISTLSSERQPDDAAADATPLASPSLYDAAREERPLPPPPSALPPPDPSARADSEPLAAAVGSAAPKQRWRLPPAHLLIRTGAQEVDRTEIEARGRDLELALASHGVETRLVGMTVGPTVTRYELELGPGVKVASVTSLHKDIAYAMASPDVRVLAPIPGRSAIGVEVPNQTRHLVSLGDILASPEAKAATHPLDVAVGRDIAGRAVTMNLATMPHLLVAGATGAGKSSCINCMVASMLMRSTPDQVRLILVDPKRVEMGQYNGLPHLLTQVVTSPKKAANALQWAVREMERRYDVLHEVGVRDIAGYNSAFDRGELRPAPGRDATYERLPLIVVIIDELNDLMMVAARDVEDSITRIAQMARAVGIHLVIATQRPSVNVITGVIKANIPARMAFAVSSLADSRVILDQPGAERLVGKGDLLLLGPASSAPQRIQGAWVSEDEVRKIVAFWRRQASDQTNYVEGIEGVDEGPGLLAGPSGDDADDEVLVRQAMELVVRSQLGSTSMLQRKLKVGFARAGRIMDLLEQRGVVGPSEGSKARAVLMSPEELDLLLDADTQA
jgi:S-DNA-T family DNA segregation ATPase FtsK/SpoIIIE